MKPTIEELRRVIELDGKATPGPWDAGTIGFGVRHLERNWEPYMENLPEGFNAPGRNDGDAGMGDGYFISFTRTAAPSMARALLAIHEAIKTGDDFLGGSKKVNAISDRETVEAIKRILGRG